MKNINKAKYAVLRTCFHGGGLISLHKSLNQAIKSMIKHEYKDCMCGCAGIVDLSADQFNHLYDEKRHRSIYLIPKNQVNRSIENSHYSDLQYQF